MTNPGGVDLELVIKAVGYTGVLGLIGEGMKWVAHRWWTRRARKTRRATVDRAEVQVEISRVLAKTSAMRVMILQSHNGGGDPRLSKPVFSTAIDEMGEPASNWDRQQLDSDYKVLLANVIEHGRVSLECEAMPPSLLRTKYEADGVARSEVYLLAIKPDGVLYLSVNFPTRDPVSAHEREVVRVAVSRLMSRYRAPTDVRISDDGSPAKKWRPMFVDWFWKPGIK